MTFPQVTALYAGLFGLLAVALGAWVIAGRVAHRVHHGDGGLEAVNRRIRAHANFAEYVPLALIVIGLLEASGAGRGTLHALLAPLLLARLAHPVGMLAPVGSPRQFACRGVSALVTLVVIAAASLLLLLRAL